MPKSSRPSSPLLPLLLGASFFLHILTLGSLFYSQTVTQRTLATLTAKLSNHDKALEAHEDDIAKNYVQNYNDNFSVRQDLSDLYLRSGASWTSPYSISKNSTRVSFSYLEPSEVISDPGDTDPEFMANFQDAYSVFYAVDVEDVTVPDIGFEDTQSMCDYFALGSEAMTYGLNTFCGSITDEIAHNILQREAIFVMYQNGSTYTFTFTARTGGTCQYEQEVTSECEEKYFTPMDEVMNAVLSSFTIEVL